MKLYLTPSMELILTNQLAIMETLSQIKGAVKAGPNQAFLAPAIEATQVGLKNAERF